MGGDWYDQDDNGFTEEERALIAMRELRALDPDAQCIDCGRPVKRPGRCLECLTDAAESRGEP